MTTFYVENIMHKPNIELLKQGFPESTIKVFPIYDEDPYINPRTNRPWKYPRYIFDTDGDEMPPIIYRGWKIVYHDPCKVKFSFKMEKHPTDFVRCCVEFNKCTLNHEKDSLCCVDRNICACLTRALPNTLTIGKYTEGYVERMEKIAERLIDLCGGLKNKNISLRDRFRMMKTDRVEEKLSDFSEEEYSSPDDHYDFDYNGYDKELANWHLEMSRIVRML